MAIEISLYKDKLFLLDRFHCGMGAREEAIPIVQKKAKGSTTDPSTIQVLKVNLFGWDGSVTQIQSWDKSALMTKNLILNLLGENDCVPVLFTESSNKSCHYEFTKPNKYQQEQETEIDRNLVAHPPFTHPPLALQLKKTTWIDTSTYKIGEIEVRHFSKWYTSPLPETDVDEVDDFTAYVRKVLSPSVPYKPATSTGIASARAPKHTNKPQIALPLSPPQLTTDGSSSSSNGESSNKVHTTAKVRSQKRKAVDEETAATSEAATEDTATTTSA